MKKLFFILLALSAITFVVTSCSDDDDNDLNLDKIVGKWMCVKSTDTYQGTTVEGLLVGAQVVINANGTYSSTAESFGKTGTYVYNGETFTAKNTNGETFIIKAMVHNNDMNWEGTSSTGVSFNYSFKRE